LRAADEGRVACHEDVVAWVRSWDQPGELDPPKCD
jgi:predicted transcriptional regulator